ncbi:hypothetical protein [Segetibacter sp. 3557_3]|uniref:hypothetical protein n=1 Tax=Segetibacter sp. 3557_3 TaxID=2547429 RepID=UPI001059069C|nr:hypothetical protein [Segetibacter sp. 3557_3]
MSVERNLDNWLKRGIWLFLFLWIFEGALRKWFLPALSEPLLIVRDPIVLALIIIALNRGLLKFHMYLFLITMIGSISFFTALFMGHGNIFTAIYGVRTLLLYFPLIFVIGNVFDQEDVVKVGRFLLTISAPMTILLALQFYSPQSAWVNRGVGGDEQGAGFGGALGYFRPPGTFSFTNGTTCFYSLVAPFLIYFWLYQKRINKLVLISATGGLLVAIPLSISRGLFLQVAVSILFLILAIYKNPRLLTKVLFGAIIISVAFKILSEVSFFETASDVFSSRFEGANQHEGGLVKGVLGNRFLGALVRGVESSVDNSMFGFGIGSGTPLGVKLLRNNKVALLADFEWMREVGEMGVLGLFLIIYRVVFALKLSILSFRKLNNNDLLPWLLMSVGILIVAQGQLHQPTALGFVGLTGGLWLASMRKH